MTKESVRAEIERVLTIKQRDKESDQAYLVRCARGINRMPLYKWNVLSTATMDWYDSACDAHDKEPYEPVPPFPGDLKFPVLYDESRIVCSAGEDPA